MIGYRLTVTVEAIDTRTGRPISNPEQRVVISPSGGSKNLAHIAKQKCGEVCRDLGMPE